MFTRTAYARPSLGIILLSIWLILSGAVGVFNLAFQGMGLVMAILAIAAGVCLLIGR